MSGLLSRRRLIRASGVGIAAALGSRAAASELPRSPIDVGGVRDGHIMLPPIADQGTEPKQVPDEPPMPRDKQVGFALLGLGRLSLEEILPAFAEAKKAKLTALISGSPEKLKAIGDAHSVKPEARYSYETFEKITQNPEVQVVYIVVPNALHHEYVLRSAKANKHVLCEKPMAVSFKEAEEMVAACNAANVHLMVAYRCQYERTNLKVADLARAQRYGPFKLVEAVNAQNQGDPGQWRLRKALSGGGCLPDIGLYCLNTIRALTGEEPIEIEAQSWSTPNDPRFIEVEEAMTWLMRFPSGLHATCSTSYGAHKAQTMLAHTPSASLLLENAFGYRGQKLRISRAERGGEIDEAFTMKPANQFALELDHMAECVLTGRRPRTPGEEGLQDQKLMEAIYRSAASRSVIAFDPLDAIDVFRGPALAAD